MGPPFAGTGGQAPPAYPTLQATGPTLKATGQSAKMYWVYWGVLFATPLTWLMTIQATVNEEWIGHDSYDDDNFAGFGTEFWKSSSSYGSRHDGYEVFIAAKAFQYMTMILVSVVLLLVTVKAFTTAPLTGKLGLPMGIVLLVSSVFQLLALALMITACHERRSISEHPPGPTAGWAVMAFVFDLAGAITVLVLRVRTAASSQDGPFTKCTSNATGVATATPAGPPSFPVAHTSNLPVIGQA